MLEWIEQKMNERIKELAEQAWDATAVSPDFGHPVSFAEKFAELIVRECVIIANEYDAPKLSGPGMMIGSMIENHFGIEGIEE